MKTKELRRIIELLMIGKDISKYANIKLLEVANDIDIAEINTFSNMLCGSFNLDNKTSSATKCKCGREKWEHPIEK